MEIAKLIALIAAVLQIGRDTYSDDDAIQDARNLLRAARKEQDEDPL